MFQSANVTRFQRKDLWIRHCGFLVAKRCLESRPVICFPGNMLRFSGYVLFVRKDVWIRHRHFLILSVGRSLGARDGGLFSPKDPSICEIYTSFCRKKAGCGRSRDLYAGRYLVRGLTASCRGGCMDWLIVATKPEPYRIENGLWT